MKIKIVQYYTGDDTKYLTLAKSCCDINSRYCKIHGYSYQFDYIQEQQIKYYYQNECTYNDILSYKIKYIEQKLIKNKDFDYIVFLDADAAVNKPQLKIEQFLDNQHQLFLSRGNEKWYQIYLLRNMRRVLETMFQNSQQLLTTYYNQGIIQKYDMYGACQILSNGKIMFNQGFMIIKNTPLMLDFFSDCYKFQLLFRNKKNSFMTGDGRSISYTVLDEKYKNCYTFMPDFAQGGIANSFETHYNEDSTFILHNYGKALTIDQKIVVILNLKKNKHWVNLINQN